MKQHCTCHGSTRSGQDTSSRSSGRVETDVEVGTLEKNSLSKWSTDRTTTVQIASIRGLFGLGGGWMDGLGDTSLGT